LYRIFLGKPQAGLLDSTFILNAILDHFLRSNNEKPNLIKSLPAVKFNLILAAFDLKVFYSGGVEYTSLIHFIASFFI